MNIPKGAAFAIAAASEPCEHWRDDEESYFVADEMDRARGNGLPKEPDK